MHLPVEVVSFNTPISFLSTLSEKPLTGQLSGRVGRPPLVVPFSPSLSPPQYLDSPIFLEVSPNSSHLTGVGEWANSV